MNFNKYLEVLNFLENASGKVMILEEAEQKKCVELSKEEKNNLKEYIQEKIDKLGTNSYEFECYYLKDEEHKIMNLSEFLKTSNYISYDGGGYSFISYDYNHKKISEVFSMHFYNMVMEDGGQDHILKEMKKSNNFILNDDAFYFITTTLRDRFDFTFFDSNFSNFDKWKKARQEYNKLRGFEFFEF